MRDDLQMSNIIEWLARIEAEMSINFIINFSYKVL